MASSGWQWSNGFDATQSRNRLWHLFELISKNRRRSSLAAVSENPDAIDLSPAAVANLARTSQVTMCGAQLRKLVIVARQSVLEVQRSAAIPHGVSGPRVPGRSSRSKNSEADRLIDYVLERCEMINFPEFLKRGWQIGRGPTESRCKMSTAHLKGRGRRWDMSNAQAVAALTELRDSNQWNLFWSSPATAKI